MALLKYYQRFKGGGVIYELKELYKIYYLNIINKLSLKTAKLGATFIYRLMLHSYNLGATIQLVKDSNKLKNGLITCKKIIKFFEIKDFYAKNKGILL